MTRLDLALARHRVPLWRATLIAIAIPVPVWAVLAAKFGGLL